MSIKFLICTLILLNVELINILNHTFRFKFKCFGCKTDLQILAPAIKEVLFKL